MIEIILLVLVAVFCAGWLISFVRSEHWKTEAIKWQIAAHQWHASSDKHRALWREEQDKHAVTNPVHPGLHSDLEAQRADRPSRPSVQPSSVQP